MRYLIPTVALCLLATLPARAQDLNTLLDIPEGATLISLSATERVEVDQDLLIAQLSYEAEDTVAANLQEEINTVMKKAIAEAKKFDKVKVSTQSYQVYPYDYNPMPNSNDPSKIIHKWRGSQSLMLKSKAPDDLLAVVGKLQEMGMNMNSLYYTVSPELMEETQNGLLEAALTKLKVKGERTAKALGKAKSDLLNVNVDTGGYMPQMARGGVMMMKAEMASDMAGAAPPVAEAGQSDITLTVNAQALVK
jgi:predicted secreted protein